MFFMRKVLAQSTTYCAYRNFRNHVKPDQNPGIGKRKKLLALKEAEEVSDIEDMESDFMGASNLHRDYEGELELKKERQKYLIVKQKYFKEKFPNFLTWNDKEQIRYLHRTDPEEWTIDKLSEGFPALPEVILKIVRSNWTKNRQDKIENHDNAVQKNWNKFKGGKMKDLPEDLVEHLNKFTNRALNFKPCVVQKPVVEVKSTPISTEFSEIITSYEKMKQNNTESSEHKQITDDMKEQRHQRTTYNESQINRRRSVTLNQLQSNVAKKIQMGRSVDDEEKYIAREGTKAEIDEVKEENNLVDLSKNKYQTTTSIQYFKKAERDISHLIIPEKITIPKNIYKEGLIYKLNDCYYSDDGEFLYRVPGMY